MKLHQQGLCCPICGIKKGRQFNHAACSKILQAQYNVKTRAPKKLRESAMRYLSESTR